jgi:hypothetical protein
MKYIEIEQKFAVPDPDALRADRSALRSRKTEL